MSEQYPDGERRPGPVGPPPPSGPAPWYGSDPPPPGYAPAPGYAAPGEPVRRLSPHPHPEPREYHQMLRTWNYAWWKPLVGVVLFAVGAVAANVVLLPVLFVGTALEPGSLWEDFGEVADLSELSPAFLLYLNLTLGSLILVAWAVLRIVHRMRPRWLSSVVPKMRWGFFFACIGLSVVSLVLVVIVGALLEGEQGTEITSLNDLTVSSALLGVVVLVTTPLQAAGEEYAFRGYLLQAFGSIFHNRTVSIVVALLVTSTLFALLHGVQNAPLFLDRFVFGLLAGWLVIRTGGLEAAIAMHILNNFLAFGFALAFGDISESLTVSQVPWSTIVLTVTQTGSYLLLVLFVARKMGVVTRTRPPAQDPAPSAAYGVPAQPG